MSPQIEGCQTESAGFNSEQHDTHLSVFAQSEYSLRVDSQSAFIKEEENMQTAKSYSRRDFLKQCAATSALAASAVPAIRSAHAKEIPLREFESKQVPPSDKIRLATIGMGIIGFIDTETALLVPGVELVAAADLYDGRRVRANEIFGKEVFTTRDYREILSRSDVDAVIVST